MPNNDNRADWAMRAIETFGTMTGQYNEQRGFNDDLPSILGDLLCNLMHFADREGVDFEQCLSTGRWHFESEGGAGNEPDDLALAGNDDEDPRMPCQMKGGVS